MAELALKIGPGANYEDGDVLDSFNRRRIRLVHAEMICHPRVDGRKVSGQLGTTQPLLEKFCQRTTQYQWERVSTTEIKRTNLWTLDEVVYGSKPIDDPDRPGHKIHCHVEEHFAFRNKSGRLPLFGKKDREIEYGGRSKRDEVTVELLWDDIEHDTPLRRADHDLWPAGVNDLKAHLFVPVVEFNEAEAEALITPWTRDTGEKDEEDNPIIETVKKRNMNANWRSPAVLALLKVSAQDIEDRGKSIDVRRNIEAISNVLLLWNKRDQTAGKRLN